MSIGFYQEMDWRRGGCVELEAWAFVWSVWCDCVVMMRNGYCECGKWLL